MFLNVSVIFENNICFSNFIVMHAHCPKFKTVEKLEKEKKTPVILPPENHCCLGIWP